MHNSSTTSLQYLALQEELADVKERNVQLAARLQQKVDWVIMFQNSILVDVKVFFFGENWKPTFLEKKAGTIVVESAVNL